MELLLWKASSMTSGIIAFMLGVEMVCECAGNRLGVDVCMMVMPSRMERRVELALLDVWSGLRSGREASFVSITLNCARVPSSSMLRSSICGEKAIVKSDLDRN